LTNQTQEAHLKKVIDYIDKFKRTSCILIVDSIGAYGINLAGAKVAISTVRANLSYSPETLKQFFARVGRKGFSSEGIVYTDLFTLFRLLDSALWKENRTFFMSIAVAIEELLKNQIPSIPETNHEWRSWLIASLRDQLVKMGMPYRDASMIEMLVCSVYSEYEEISKELGISGPWSLANMLKTLGAAGSRISCCSDTSNFGLYASFMQVQVNTAEQPFQTIMHHINDTIRLPKEDENSTNYREHQRRMKKEFKEDLRAQNAFGKRTL
jgi:hypothetical protein